MTETEKKTGNEPASGTDPGGTRPAPGHAGGDDKHLETPVKTGDRNDMRGTDKDKSP